MSLKWFLGATRCSGLNLPAPLLSGLARATTAIALGGALLLFSHTVSLAGDTTYSTDMAITQSVSPGGVATYDFIATSPTLPVDGPNQLSEYLQNVCSDNTTGVEAQFLVKDMTYTPTGGDSETYDFSSWLTIDPSRSCYVNDGQAGPPVTVTVNVPSGAASGQYDAKLAADSVPHGVGWGEGAGIHISLIVAPANSCPAPVVSFIKPTDQQKFKLGNRVPVDFTATDSDSQCPVTSWTANLIFVPADPNFAGTIHSVDVSSLLSEGLIANGLEMTGSILTASVPPGVSQTILQIGNYKLEVTATSAGGTSLPVDQSFTVNYDIQPIAPDLTQASLSYSKSANHCTNQTPGTIQVKFNALVVDPPDTASSSNTAELFDGDQTVTAKIGTLIATYTDHNATGFAIAGSTGDTTVSTNYLWKPVLCSLANNTYPINVYFGDYYGLSFFQYTKNVTVSD